MKRVLFICLGNICRSPTAEGVFTKLAEQANVPMSVDSAGTAGWHIGKSPYGPAVQAARARGYDLSQLRARQAHAGDFDDFDLIIGMDDSNLEEMERLRPNGNETELRLFTDFAEAVADEVPDPYYTRDFEGALDLIEDASRGLLRTLANRDGSGPS